MPTRAQDAGGDLRLEEGARALLARRVERASRRAAAEARPVVAAVTVPVPARTDLSAAVLDSRGSADSVFCLEQPARGGFALAGLGAAAEVVARGPSRFADAAARCRTLARGAEAGDSRDDPAAPPASGAVWVGGFAFAEEGGGAPEWGSLAPARLVLPEVSLARQDGEARMTVAALVGSGEEPEAVLDRLDARVGSLSAAPMPLLDPDLLDVPRVSGAMPPEHYEAAVARAVELIEAAEVQKLVLAREVRVHHRAPIDPAPLLGALREIFPECYSYLVGTRELAFLGASPELLVRRDGARAQTVALAGTTRRSADPAVDRHLGERLAGSEKNREEQAIVTRRIERTLAPVSLWTAAAEEPALVRVQNVQHLATPIRAQLSEPLSVLELAGLLHPTPATGGEPGERALELLPALEGLDRGWYAGPVGWTDLAEDGEMCVALRCVLLRDRVGHLYAGAGVVSGSVPAEELAETEMKLAALLPLLS